MLSDCFGARRSWGSKCFGEGVSSIAFPVIAAQANTPAAAPAPNAAFPAEGADFLALIQAILTPRDAAAPDVQPAPSAPDSGKSKKASNERAPEQDQKGDPEARKKAGEAAAIPVAAAVPQPPTILIVPIEIQAAGSMADAQHQASTMSQAPQAPAAETPADAGARPLVQKKMAALLEGNSAFRLTLRGEGRLPAESSTPVVAASTQQKGEIRTEQIAQPPSDRPALAAVTTAAARAERPDLKAATAAPDAVPEGTGRPVQPAQHESEAPPQDKGKEESRWPRAAESKAPAVEKVMPAHSHDGVRERENAASSVKEATAVPRAPVQAGATVSEVPAEQSRASSTISRNTDAPVVTRMAAAEATPTPPSTTPAREIALRVTDAEAAQNVDLHVVERAGKIHVDVRSPDPVLSQSLRSHLGELVQQFDARGMRVESVSAAGHSGGTHALEAAMSHSPAGGGFGEGDPPGNGPGNGPSTWNGQDGRQQQRRAQQAWSDYFDDTLNDTVPNRRNSWRQ